MSIENSVARDDRFAFLLDAPREVEDPVRPKAVAVCDDAAGYATDRSAPARLDACERKLRDPLRAIVATSTALRQHLGDAHAGRLDAITQAALRLDKMTRDLLDFVRCAVEGVQLTRRRTDMKVLCERVVDNIRDLYPDRAMILTAAEPIEGICDPDAVAGMLTGLVLNALDHGGLRAAVRVTLLAQGENMSLEVWNAGPSIERRLRTELFEPFACGEPSTSQETGGLGLGLYFAREIVRAHRGSIEVESTDHGGTTFRVQMPRL